MNDKHKLHDVFLYHAPSDTNLAIAVKQKFDTQELPTVLVGEVKPVKKQLDALLHELETTRCFVTLCTPAAIREQSLPLLFGAAWGQTMPIYTLRSGIPSRELPAYLANYDDFELWDGMQPLMKKIRIVIRPLSNEHLETLIDCYREIGIPLDEYRKSFDSREALTELFVERSGAKFDEDRLVRELRRLKAMRKLPKLAARTAG